MARRKKIDDDDPEYFEPTGEYLESHEEFVKKLSTLFSKEIKVD